MKWKKMVVYSSSIIFGIILAVSFPSGIVSGIISPQISSDPNGVRFFICTKEGDSRAEHELFLNDTNSISQSPMNPTLPSTILIHGYRRDRTRELVQHLISAYLNSTPNANNYLVVDWGALSGLQHVSTTVHNLLDPPVYAMVVGRSIPIVFRRTLEFIQQLVGMEIVRLSDLHIIGHSLGAHIAGYLGKEIHEIYGKKVARVTGLDPAGPGFEGLIRARRKLKKDDADFVDVYHTAMGTMGDTSVDGHADFYINGGRLQPPCPQDDNIIPPLNDPFSKGRCSHEFITNIYAATITKEFKACRCNLTKLSPSQLESCYETCPDPVVAGENVPTSTVGRYYFRTSANL